MPVSPHPLSAAAVFTENICTNRRFVIFSLFFHQSFFFSSRTPGATNPTTLFPPTLYPSLLPSDSTYPCTVLLPVTSDGACNLRITARNYQWVRGRELIAALARNQRYITWLCYRTVTVLVARKFFCHSKKECRHTSHVRLSSNLLRSVLPIVVSISFGTNATCITFVRLQNYTCVQLAIESRWRVIFGKSSKSISCSESVKKFTRAYNTFYFSRKLYALEKYI